MAKTTGASRSETRNQSSDAIHVPEPKLHQRAHELQPYGHVVKLPIALSDAIELVTKEMRTRIF